MAGSNNRSIVRRSLLTLLLIALPLTCQADCVILLHGLARTSGSMEPVEELLTDEGYTVVNVDYPSRDYPIEILAPMAIDEGLLLCPANERRHAAKRNFRQDGGERQSGAFAGLARDARAQAGGRAVAAVLAGFGPG